jgi:pyruvate dehydrogenase E1 component alpha subunit
MIRFLSDDGTPTGDLPLSETELLRGYRAMVRGRLIDERMVVLQRQGRMGVYASFRGQEAAQVGSALALEAGDWMIPSYRESCAAIEHGLPVHQLILYWRSHPAGWQFPEGLRLLPFSIPIATHLPQAVGVSVAGRYHQEPWVAMTFVGDGGTSEGDFHEALNFAAVMNAPLVFVVQNNGWAISVPTHKQMKNTKIADRARGYGIPGVVVDGNDLVAVWYAAREAVRRARSGKGPALLEAVTYRMSAHTTSDDPQRYRGEDELKRWEAKDPIARLRTALEGRGFWDDEQEAELRRSVKAEIEEAVRTANSSPEPSPHEIVEQVFAEMTPDQKWAWEALRDH